MIILLRVRNDSDPASFSGVNSDKPPAHNPPRPAPYQIVRENCPIKLIFWGRNVSIFFLYIHPRSKGRIAWGTYDSNIVGYNH